VEEVMHRFENKNRKTGGRTGEAKTGRQAPERTKIERAPAEDQR
jgi:hypothetical protein